jgi:hypothetical protein
MKNIIKNVRHGDDDDDRDVGVVWNNLKTNLEKITNMNHELHADFYEIFEAFKILDELMKRLEEKEFLLENESDAYKNLKDQIQMIKEGLFEVDENRNFKFKIEDNFLKDIKYLNSYFEQMLNVDLRGIIGLTGNDKDLI